MKKQKNTKMVKQSSIEWLIECLNIHLTEEQKTQFEGLFQQSKQMHKDEISESFEVGYENGACVYDGESIYHGSNYYNKIYGGNND